LRSFFLIFTLMLIPLQTLRAEVDVELLDKMETLTKDGYAGLEVWTSAPSTKTKGATFGHTMLRFVDDDNNPLNDLVLSFRATIPEGEQLKISKALAHEYEMGMDHGSVQSFWSLNLIWQERPIYRHVVVSTAQLRQNLVTKLRADLIRNDGNFGKYALLENSCLSVVLRFLKGAGFPMLERNEVLPTKIDEYLNSTFLSPFVFDDIKMPENVASIRAKVQLALVTSDLSQLRPIEIQSFLQFPPAGFAFSLRGKLADELSSRMKGHSTKLVPLEKLMNLDVLPKELYELCLDGKCTETVAQSYQRFSNENGSEARLRLPKLRENSSIVRSRNARARGKNLEEAVSKVSDPLNLLDLFKAHFEGLSEWP